MDFYLRDNPDMDITKIIAANLSAWMDGNIGPTTLKELARASGVGFGTVQRAKNASGNTTIQNLESIANAYKKHAIDLLDKNAAMYAMTSATIAHAREPERTVLKFGNGDSEHPAITEVLKLMRRMNDHGKARALKHVQLVSEEHIFEPQSIKHQ